MKRVLLQSVSRILDYKKPTELILLCDCGSTSSDWALLSDKEEVKQFKFSGFNPLYHDPARLQQILSELQSVTHAGLLREIRYFGTGVVSSKMKSLITGFLQEAFPGAVVHVDTDLMGAVLVTTHGQPGIVSILGTGSNACMYDGGKVVSLTPSLGYVLGDEGSGCDLGKHLCRDYYYNRLPQPITEEMGSLLPGSRSEFLEALRNHVAPNRFLASFGSVATKFSEYAYIEGLVMERFRKFFLYHIQPYDPGLTLHAVGSVAFGFQEIFNTIATEFGYITGNIIKQPINGLIELARKKDFTWQIR